MRRVVYQKYRNTTLTHFGSLLRGLRPSLPQQQNSKLLTAAAIASEITALEDSLQDYIHIKKMLTSCINLLVTTTWLLLLSLSLSSSSSKSLSFVSAQDEPPNCIVPSLLNNNPNNTTNTTNTNGTNTFSGLLWLEMIGRPPFSMEEVTAVEEALAEIYQNLTDDTCDVGVYRKLQQVQVIPNPFRSTIMMMENEDEDEDEDEDGNTNGTSRKLLLEGRSFLDDPEDFFFHHARYLQTTNNTSNTTFNNNNNNTNNNNTDRPPQVIIVNRPIVWLARLTGICNGCALGAGLFDDINRETITTRHRRHLLHQQKKEQVYYSLMHTLRGVKEENDAEAEGEVSTTSSSGPLLRMMEEENKDEEDDDSDNNICNCPGPTIDSFSVSLIDKVDELVERGKLPNVNSIQKMKEYKTNDDSEEDNDCSQEDVEVFCTSMIVQVSEPNCISSFENNNDSKEEDASWNILRSTVEETFNIGNLLNGEYCDPMSRRILSVTASSSSSSSSTPREVRNDEDDCLLISSVYLDITAECIGCNGILFDTAAAAANNDTTIANNGDDNRVRHLRELEEDEDSEEEDEEDDDDWMIPLCFCPAEATQQGLTQSKFKDLLNASISILQVEQDTSWTLQDISGVELGGEDCGKEEEDDDDDDESSSTSPPTTTATTATPMTADPTSAPTSGPTSLPSASPTTLEPTSAPTLANPGCLENGKDVNFDLNTGKYCETCTDIQTLELVCGPADDYDCDCIDDMINIIWDDECENKIKDLVKIYEGLCVTPEPTPGPTPGPTTEPTVEVNPGCLSGNPDDDNQKYCECTPLQIANLKCGGLDDPETVDCICLRDQVLPLLASNPACFSDFSEEDLTDAQNLSLDICIATPGADIDVNQVNPGF